VRVRFLTHAYPRWDGDVAGAFIARLAAGVRAAGFEVEVAAPSDGGQGGPVATDAVPARSLRYAPATWETLAYRGTMVEGARSVPGGLAALGMVGAFARAAGGRRVDCVHAHWWVPAGVGAWMRRAVGGPPYVVTMHGTDVTLLARSRGVRRVAGRVLRRAAAVTTVSNFLADRVADAVGIDREQILVQPMPLDTARYTPHEHGGGGIAIVGRLVPQKRVALLLDAIALLGSEAPAVRVIGDGPERSALEAQADELGLRVTFTGAIPPESLPDRLASADVVAFAGRHEGLGLVVAEALLLSVPVVATNDGGGVVDLMVDGAGCVVDATPPAVAEGLRSVLDDPQARRDARGVGEALRATVRTAAVAETFAGVYRRAVGGDA
jgi:glycosyltransferase involved in cell wall biosynthesis